MSVNDGSVQKRKHRFRETSRLGFSELGFKNDDKSSLARGYFLVEGSGIWSSNDVENARNVRYQPPLFRTESTVDASGGAALLRSRLLKIHCVVLSYEYFQIESAQSPFDQRFEARSNFQPIPMFSGHLGPPRNPFQGPMYADPIHLENPLTAEFWRRE